MYGELSLLGEVGVLRQDGVSKRTYRKLLHVTTSRGCDFRDQGRSASYLQGVDGAAPVLVVLREYHVHTNAVVLR